MAGFTDAYECTVLDLAIHSTTDVIKFATSAAGANATTGVAIAFAAAANGAKANSAAGETGTISAGGTFTHFALFATGGSTQKTDWTTLSSQVVVSAGGKITWQASDFSVTLD